MVNSFCGELDTVCRSIQMDLQRFCILLTSWSGQHSCVDTLNIWKKIFCTGGQLIDHKIQNKCMSNRSQDRFLDTWTNLTGNYVDRTVVRLNWFHHCIIVRTIKSIPMT